MAPASKTSTARKGKGIRKRGWISRVFRWLLVAALSAYAAAAVCLVGLRWIDPFTTSVQIERRAGALLHRRHYTKEYRFVPLTRISPAFQHAVVAAEDARFYLHHGFDWKQVQDAVEDGLEDGHIRGASTITQQLVKNLFLTTWRSPIRKALEVSLVPLAELILSKQRILELYINVIEWGPGVYGAEAAARYHYHTSAAQITRDQGAHLAAVLPSPLRRRPARMRAYPARILERMHQMNW